MFVVPQSSALDCFVPVINRTIFIIEDPLIDCSATEFDIFSIVFDMFFNESNTIFILRNKYIIYRQRVVRDSINIISLTTAIVSGIVI